MNTQLNPASQPDIAIDRVLHALRTTEPPAGLEQRIAARLAQAAEARTAASAFPQSAQSGLISYFAVILNAVKDPRILLAAARRKFIATAALTLLIALTTLTLLHHHPATTTAQTDFRAHANPAPQSLATTSLRTTQDRTVNFTLEGAGLQSRHHAPAATSALPAGVISHPPSPSAQTPDLDQLALAETLAPSHPAPPMPLTAQEHLMLAATRPGQPIQLAELGTARAPLLRAAAQAREEASISRYVKSLLFPFAVADALSPTTDSQPQELSTPAPPPSK